MKMGIELGVLFYADCAEKLFDLVDGFAESTKRKAAVWPLQIILLVLCPEIIQDIAKDVVEETKMNKVRGEKYLNSSFDFQRDPACILVGGGCWISLILRFLW